MSLKHACRVLWILALPANLIAMWMVFAYAPVEMQMGAVQKIFYYHVSSAISGYVMVFLAFCFSIAFIWKERRGWDILAHAAAEVGWIFLSIVIITGPVWGRAAWGKWWVWEPRLTTALILWFMYTAYVLLRSMAQDEERQAKMAAVLAIVAFFDVPIVNRAVAWWGSTVHPQRVGLSPEMKVTFVTSMGAVLLLASALFITRVWAGKLEAVKRDGEIEEKA